MDREKVRENERERERERERVRERAREREREGDREIGCDFNSWMPGHCAAILALRPAAIQIG
jgi:hypothetical protein